MKRKLKTPRKITITPEDISRNREFKFAYPNNSFWYGKYRHNMQALKYHSPALEKQKLQFSNEKLIVVSRHPIDFFVFYYLVCKK